MTGTGAWGGRRRRSFWGRERAQATVELALALPVVALAALLVVQVAIVVRAQILVVQSAREGARAAAVDDRANAARDAAQTPGLASDQLSVARGLASGEKDVHVAVTYRVRTDVPLVGALLPDVAVSANATMRRESASGG